MPTVNLVSKISRDKKKSWWYFEYGRGSGQRISTGVFTYVKPNTILEKNHNKFITGKLQTEQAQRILDLSGGIGPHLSSSKLHKNLLDFYTEWVEENKKPGNRHVEGSLRAFRIFLQGKLAPLKGKPDEQLFLSPDSVTEELCIKFQEYLVKKHTGDTPSNYFSRFKKMIHVATKQGYFRVDPCADIGPKKGRKNQKKDVLTMEEFELLCKLPCRNPEVKKAFLFSFLTGVRGQTLRSLQWGDIKDSEHGLFISVIQDKTGEPMEVPLLKEALVFLSETKGEKKEKVFKLPGSINGYNKVLKVWMEDVGIDKHITGHCARHSLGTILKSGNLSDLLIADILGHTSTKYVGRYSRMSELNRKREGMKAAIAKGGLHS